MLLFFTGIILVCTFKFTLPLLIMVVAIFGGASLPTALSFSRRLRSARAVLLLGISVASVVGFHGLTTTADKLAVEVFVISFYAAFATITFVERKATRQAELQARKARFALRADLDQIFSNVRNRQPSSTTSISIDAARLPEYSLIAASFGRNGWEAEMRFERREGVTLHLRAPSSLTEMDRSLTKISCETR